MNDKEARDLLRSALVRLVGADSREELEQMELALRTMPAPPQDKADALGGVQALLMTLE